METCNKCNKALFADSNKSHLELCDCKTEHIFVGAIAYAHVERDSHFFTELEQILGSIAAEQIEYTKIGVLNSIKHGYKLVHKDELISDVLPGYKFVKDIKVVPYQLCPKCFGTGKVMNNENWGNSLSCSVGPVTCDVCNGAKVIPQAIV
jgi:hypothetical protein